MKGTRTFVFEKDNYTKEEVVNIVGEIIEESKQEGFQQYEEVYLNDKDFPVDEEYDLEQSLNVPFKWYFLKWEI